MVRYEDYLAGVYYDADHPASFSGVDKLYRAVRKEGRFVLSRSKIEQWLGKQETHAVHAEEKTKFKRRRVLSPRVDYQWDADTADMTTYSNNNDGYGYFLLVVDVMSKYVWTKALRNKTSKEMVQAFREIFADGRKPTRMRTDKGSEFVNRKVDGFLEKEGVPHFVTQNIVKANIAERAIKTIKMRLARYATRKQTRRWIDVLPKVTNSYNHTHHRSIKQTPASVKSKDSVRLWKLQYETVPRPRPKSKTPTVKKLYAFKVGDVVRVSFLRWAFQRQYDERWSRELFVITERFASEGIPQYRLKDYSGEIVHGTFYQKQLHRAHEQETYLVERVLRQRKRRGKKEFLVRWQGWLPKYDSWIGEEDLRGLEGGI
ncbi:hypothetical protein BOW24_11450 [Solemya velum gill symbiont]|nr:hypothetical protein BOW24_11450 [Solemya velum gill symbiont]